MDVEKLIRNHAFLILVLVLISCSTAPEFERTNLNDPSSDNFIPDPPENSIISYELFDNRDLKMSWSKEENQDGVIISKSYRGDNNYILLDTLYSDTTYIDDSKLFIQGTTYKFEFFRDVENVGLVFNSVIPEIPIPFRRITDIYVGYSNSILLDLYFDNSTESINYFDGISVSINDNSIGEDNWIDILEISFEEIQDIDENDFGQIAGITIDTEYEVQLFNLELRVNQFITDSLNNRITITNNEASQRIRQIVDLDYTVIDEMNGELRWRNPLSAVTDKYVISGAIQDTLNNITGNSTSISFRTPPTYPVTFSITPYIGANVGNTINSYRRYANIYPPSFSNLTSINDNTLELAWNSAGEAAGYFVKKKSALESVFSLVDSTDRNTRNLTVTNLDSNLEYDFKVHSYTSEDSPIIKTRYQNSLYVQSQEATSQFSESIKYSENKTYIVKQMESAMYIENVGTGTSYTFTLPVDEWGGPATVKDYAISESTNTIAVIIDLDDVDNCCSSVLIYDFLNNQTISDTPVGSSAFKIQTLENDSLFVYNDRSSTTFEPILKFLNPFNIQTEFETLNDIDLEWGWLTTLQNSNLILNCSETSGFYSLNLINGIEQTILNQPCSSVNYLPAENIAIVQQLNSIVIIDLSTQTILNNYSNSIGDISIWSTQYFKEIDVFLYRERRSFYGFKYIQDATIYDLFIASLTENRGVNILYVEPTTDSRYEILTNDSKVILDLDESWVITETN